MTNDIDHLADLCNNWAVRQFPDRNIGNTYIKLLEEVVELFKSPTDPDEYADVFILLLDMAAHHGVALGREINRKLEINQMSSWIQDKGTWSRIKTSEIEPIQESMREVTKPGDYL